MSKDRKEYLKNYNRKHYLEHKEEILKKQKEYQTENKEKVSERHRKYNQKIKASNSILNELEEWLKEKWYEIEPKGTGINFNCEYDSEEDYVRGMETKSKLNTLKNILNKIQELKEKYSVGDKE